VEIRARAIRQSLAAFYKDVSSVSGLLFHVTNHMIAGRKAVKSLSIGDQSWKRLTEIDLAIKLDSVPVPIEFGHVLGSVDDKYICRDSKGSGGVQDSDSAGDFSAYLRLIEVNIRRIWGIRRSQKETYHS
jgi:hypothetical protein